MAKLWNYLGQKVGKVADDIFGHIGGEVILDILDRGARGFSVGFWGRLSDRFRAAFASTLYGFVAAEQAEGATGSGDMKINLERVQDFLRTLPNWQRNHYMLQVVLPSNNEDRYNILRIVFHAAHDNDPVRMRQAVEEVAGTEPPLTSVVGEKLNNFIRRQIPDIWEEIKDAPGGVIGWVQDHWPEIRAHFGETWDYFINGTPPQPGQAQPGWPGLPTRLHEWAEASNQDAEQACQDARGGKWVIGGTRFSRIFF